MNLQIINCQYNFSLYICPEKKMKKKSLLHRWQKAIKDKQLHGKLGSLYKDKYLHRKPNSSLWPLHV